MSEVMTDKYKKPYIILLSACDRAASALPEGNAVRSMLIEAMNRAEDAWIEADETAFDGGRSPFRIE